MDGWMDTRLDKKTDGRMNGRMDRYKTDMHPPLRPSLSLLRRLPFVRPTSQRTVHLSVCPFHASIRLLDRLSARLSVRLSILHHADSVARHECE